MLFNHTVGAKQEFLRDRETERLRGTAVVVKRTRSPNRVRYVCADNAPRPIRFPICEYHPVLERRRHARMAIE